MDTTDELEKALHKMYEPNRLFTASESYTFANFGLVAHRNHLGAFAIEHFFGIADFGHLWYPTLAYPNRRGRAKISIEDVLFVCRLSQNRQSQ
jgi:hypothetical protein